MCGHIGAQVAEREFVLQFCCFPLRVRALPGCLCSQRGPRYLLSREASAIRIAAGRGNSKGLVALRLQKAWMSRLAVGVLTATSAEEASMRAMPVMSGRTCRTDSSTLRM